MTDTRSLIPTVATAKWAVISPLFDRLVASLAEERLSKDEAELLAGLPGADGEVALRDDARFRPTPAGRWILAGSYLANELLAEYLRRSPAELSDLKAFLLTLDEQIGRRTVFCPDDPRFVLTDSTLRLAASQLSDEPLIEESVCEADQYRTHLPLFRLRDIAYHDHQSSPEDDILDLTAPCGWIRVKLAEPLDRRMFVARIEDESMDDGQSRIRRCDYAVFVREASPIDRTSQTGAVPPEAVCLVRGVRGQTGLGFYELRQLEVFERGEIVLRPLHPDRSRYALTWLRPADGDAVWVVARLAVMLTPKDYARAPRAARYGRRLVDDCRYQQRRFDRLRRGVTRFFNGELADPFISSPAPWEAHPICLAAEAGGLRIELGPFPDFWSFVRELQLVGEGWERGLDVTGLRRGARSVAVAPWTTPLHWKAVGFENDDSIDLSRLALPALPAEVVTVFRVDREGRGRLVGGARLKAGRHYRLLIPPRLKARLRRPAPIDDPADSPALTALGGDWTLWELELPASPPPWLADQLTALGLGLTAVGTALEWTIVPPVEWARNGREELYPRFLPETGVVLRVDGPLVEEPGDAVLLLIGAGAGEERRLFPLPAGRQALVRLSDLSVGRYAVEILHRRRDIQAERAFFEVVAAPPAPPRAQALIGIGGEWHALTPGQTLTLPGASLLTDLATALAPEGQSTLEFEAPPFWPVRCSWKSVTVEPLFEMRADRAGRLNGWEILALVRPLCAARRVGELHLDSGELGRVIIRHHRQQDTKVLRKAITELVIDRAPFVRRQAGEYLATIPIWFEPLLKHLGYVTADLMLADAPPGWRVLKLLHEEWQETGMVRRPARLLFLCPELRDAAARERFDWMDRQAREAEIDETLISDGLGWARRRRSSWLPLKVRDLEWVVDDEDAFIDFLREVGEGI